MEYITVAEAAAAWQLSEQMIRKQCREGIIPGAYREGRSWLIPDYAQKHIPDTDREKKETPHLARKLQKQKTKKSFHGLYDYIQIYFTYCSNRMASNRLSQKQIEMIYKKGKVQDCFEPVKVSDLVETLNHHVCIDYIIDHTGTANTTIRTKATTLRRTFFIIFTPLCQNIYPQTSGFSEYMPLALLLIKFPSDSLNAGW